MSIISVRNNENNRWKTNEQKNNDRKEQGGPEAIVKGWELNGFVAHLSQVVSN